MTQQSLITRLKAVEEALEELDTLARNFSVSGVYFAEFKENVSALNESNRTLSDLRELIKKAEGQRHVGVIEHDTSSYVWEELTPGTNLYTALGEKP